MKPVLHFKGPVTTQSGYGVHARQLLDGLIRSKKYDIHLQALTWGNTAILNASQDPRIAAYENLARRYENGKAKGQKYDISIQVTIPNEFERNARLVIGVTAGIECDHVSPQWLLKANSDVDVLVVPSKHAADVFQSTAYQGSDGSVLRLNKPAIVVPEGVDTTLFNLLGPTEESKQFSFSTKFNFLHVGLGLDKPFGEDRKNIANLVRWFCERFSDDEDVGLVLKVNVVNSSKLDKDLVTKRIGEIKQVAGAKALPRIHLVHERLTDVQLAGLMRHESIKAFVSLTHGEGFGLPILEAAACGLPVIATDWSGHLDFLKKGDRKLFVSLAYKLEEIPQSAVWPGVMEHGSKWASADEVDAKEKMFKVAKSYATPKRWATELAAHVAAEFNLVKTSDRFVELTGLAFGQMVKARPQTQAEVVQSFKDEYKASAPDRRKLLLTMPMSAGDVYLATGLLGPLRHKHPDCDIFFATSPQYRQIVEGHAFIHQVIDFQPWMTDVGTCEDLFDHVYTPNLGVQMKFSNWVHRGEGRNIVDEFAVQCGVTYGNPRIELLPPPASMPPEYVVFNPGSGKGQWSARAYNQWKPVVDSLVAAGVNVVQVGTIEEPFYDGCIDMRGRTPDPRMLAHVISGCMAFVGIDSFPMHLAAHVTDVPVVALFGSSYATSTGPKKKLLHVLETPDRNGCDRACYQYTCKVDADNPCINNIPAQNVVAKLSGLLFEKLGRHIEYVERLPMLSGYTHVLNAESQGYPYLESIVSMLGFCDEVVVVDGGSTDGTRQKLEEYKALYGDQLQIHDHEWDAEEPGMDGMQKAFARAMCSGEFLWQQDADEVVHEQDYGKIKKMLLSFPNDVDLLHLPVVELWGNERTVRTDRHSWKWRLSRNDFRITHGIVKHARLEDPKTGRTYAKKGMSDGCEFIDVMTGEYIPHKGFYTQELEELRQTDPQAYGERMNKIFERLPAVFHYSWANLKRKVQNFKSFWDNQWNVLYQSPAEPRFPDVVDEESLEAKVLELAARGGEHGFADVFELKRSNPEIMRPWIEEIGK
jgi:ADP-heptose:LPS heptosyltransferase/glycosyltransferase involved in cell wall biosynthesis